MDAWQVMDPLKVIDGILVLFRLTQFRNPQKDDQFLFGHQFVNEGGIIRMVLNFRGCHIGVLLNAFHFGFLSLVPAVGCPDDGFGPLFRLRPVHHAVVF